MKPIPRRLQLAVVAAGYLAVLLVAALLIYVRHMQYVNHAADVAAAGGMYAAGDWMLELFIVGLFLIPTFLLVLVIRKSETAYTRYSQALLGVSLTAPICLGVLLIPAVSQGNSLLGWLCMDRVLVSPLVVVGLAVSRLLVRFSRAKRLDHTPCSSQALLHRSIDHRTAGQILCGLQLSVRQVQGTPQKPAEGLSRRCGE